MRLWIDTDVGMNPDDAIALLLACAHPEVQLVGVSTVAGDTEARADIARQLLASVGRSAVEVVAGARLEPRAVAMAQIDALLGIGPLTNVDRMVEARVVPKRIAVMGGARRAVHHRGEWRETETNFGTDPEAAARVLRDTDALVVPLDVTAPVVLDDDERDRLAAEVPALRAELERWAAPVCIHDPVALFALLEEPFVSVRSLPLSVDPRGRLSETPDALVKRVVVDVDPSAAIARTFQLLGEPRR